MPLDPAIDTSVACSDGSIAKAGSFRGPALIVPNGVDPGLIALPFAAATSSSRAESLPLSLLLPPSQIQRQKHRRRQSKREALGQAARFVERALSRSLSRTSVQLRRGVSDP